MFIEEADAKGLLAELAIATPDGATATSAEEALQVAQRLAASGAHGVMVKAQVPAGGRNKGGGVAACDSPEQAAVAAGQMLAMTVGGFDVERVLVEARADIAAELYVSFLVDAESSGPLLIASAEGGVDIEQVHAARPEAVSHHLIDIGSGLTDHDAQAVAAAVAPDHQAEVAGFLARLYAAFRQLDAQLIEINPLAITRDLGLVALDAKIVIDDNALFRQPSVPAQRFTGTELEKRCADQDFLLVELDGDVGVVANGAGLTMATIDAVTALGGRPANFLEVGGMAYRRAGPALELVLSNPKVKSLLVNLCGAYARTDVIAEGLIEAWHQLSPAIDVSFCVHGTGEERARELIGEHLGIRCHDRMDDAIHEAIANAASNPGSSNPDSGNPVLSEQGAP